MRLTKKEILTNTVMALNAKAARYEQMGCEEQAVEYIRAAMVIEDVLALSSFPWVVPFVWACIGVGIGLAFARFL